MSSFNLNGQVLIACNCDWGCPCNVNALPSRGFCEGGWVWQIERGHVDETTLDGLALGLFCKWPGAIHEGGGEAIGFTDARADQLQTDAMERLLRGEVGGPWEILINTYSILSLKAASFDVRLAEHVSSAKIGDVVTLEIQPIKNPVTGNEAHPEIVLPEGFVVKHAALAASKTFTVSDGISYDHSGQYTAFGAFEYAAT